MPASPPAPIGSATVQAVQQSISDLAAGNQQGIPAIALLNALRGLLAERWMFVGLP